MRETLKACSPTWLTQPPTTWPTSVGSMPVRSMIARWTFDSTSAGCMVDRPPPRLPMGVRTASTMTTFELEEAEFDMASTVELACRSGSARETIRVLRMHLMSPRPNTSDLYSPVNDEPVGHDGPRRYIHVIGATVFVDDQVADDSWGRHVVAVVDGCVLWAVDVPAEADDPSYGSALGPVLLLRAGVGGRLVRRRPGRAARRVGAHPSLLWPLRNPDRTVGRRARHESVRPAGSSPIRESRRR